VGFVAGLFGFWSSVSLPFDCFFSTNIIYHASPFMPILEKP
jgi:hypothetical protein